MKIHKKHSLAIRWMHGLNFPLLAIMVWSGILIYWANDAYIPLRGWIARTFNIQYHLSLGLAWHLFTMWLFTVNGVAYVIYLYMSGEWRFSKYNSAQRVAYPAVIVIAAVSVLTGLAIYKPVQLGALTEMLGGYEWARFEHFVCMIILILFFIVHVIQVIRAGWNTFRAMITGFEIEEK